MCFLCRDWAFQIITDYDVEILAAEHRFEIGQAHYNEIMDMLRSKNEPVDDDDSPPWKLRR